MHRISMLSASAPGERAMIGKVALRLFLLPGNAVADALGARDDEDRTMIRTLINMLVWNLVGVLAVVALW